LGIKDGENKTILLRQAGGAAMEQNEKTVKTESIKPIPAVERIGRELQDDERDKNFNELNLIIESLAGDKGQLIRILQKAQDIFGYLPDDVQAFIAERLGVPVAEVNGVVTFYSLFSTKPKGKYIINVCMGTACYVKGAQQVMDALKKRLKIDEGETTPDGLFTLKSTRCVGACGLAPILAVNGKVQGMVDPGKIQELIKNCRKGEKNENQKH